MSVAAQVVEYELGTTERWFGVDNPIFPKQWPPIYKAGSWGTSHPVFVLRKETLASAEASGNSKAKYHKTNRLFRRVRGYFDRGTTVNLSAGRL